MQAKGISEKMTKCRECGGEGKLGGVIYTRCSGDGEEPGKVS